MMEAHLGDDITRQSSSREREKERGGEGGVRERERGEG